MKFLDRLSDAYYKGEPLVSNEYFDELAKRYGYTAVGTSTEREITHAYRLYSLDKFYPGEQPPFTEGVRTPKLDGAAVAVYYSGGKMVWGATRGNGVRGQDITEKMSHLVPTSISGELANFGDFQLIGEVVTTVGKDNLRNYASGALNLKDLGEFKNRELYFIVYDMVPSPCATYEETLSLVAKMGFGVVNGLYLDKFPMDGEVVRLNSNEEYEPNHSFGY